MNEIEHVKIHFELEKDEDGWPPSSGESLWGFKIADGTLQIDNVPWFVKGVSLGDRVTAERIDDQNYRFLRVVLRQGHSTFRALPRSQDRDVRAEALREGLMSLGCSAEIYGAIRMLAIDIPPDVELGRVRDFLMREQDWDYEESATYPTR